VALAAFGDWLSDLVAQGDGAASYMGGVGARSAAIRVGTDYGLGPTQILRGMRSAGLGMRTQNFYQLAHQVTSADSGTGGWTWGGPGSTIDPADINQLSGGTAGKYMVNVRSTWTGYDENGDRINGETRTNILQDELDLDQAIADAQQIQGNKYVGQGGEGGTITGWDVTSVNQWQGK
jgi:hypothetical protein